MIKEVFLHVGLPKTGTTFLQHKLHLNSDELRGLGVYVPRTGLDAVLYDHNLLALALQPERWGEVPPDVARGLPSLWLDLELEITSCAEPFVLISAETLSWELSNRDQIEIVRQRLLPFKVSIVICEREPYAFIASMYGHILRTGRGPYSLESFLREFPYYWDIDFQKSRWAEFFGAENILCVSYEAIKGDLIAEKFLRLVFSGRIDFPTEFPYMADTNRNQSFSPRFLRFIEELSANRISPDPYIDLYSKAAETFVPLETRAVERSDIDFALGSCGLTLSFRPMTDPWSRQQTPPGEHQLRGSKDNLLGPIATTPMEELQWAKRLLAERTERLEQASGEIVMGQDALGKCTQELVDLRRLLAERTERLALALEEAASAREALVKCTDELVDVRYILADRTTMLEQANRLLDERTRELMICGQALVERTALLERSTSALEQSANDLLDRTNELERTREVLVERTEALQQTSQALNVQSQELQTTRESLAEYVATTASIRKDLDVRTGQLAEARQAGIEYAQSLAQANKASAQQTQEIVAIRATLVERTGRLEQSSAELLTRTSECESAHQELLAQGKLLEETQATLTLRTHTVEEALRQLALREEMLVQLKAELLEKTNQLATFATKYGEARRSPWAFAFKTTFFQTN